MIQYVACVKDKASLRSEEPVEWNAAELADRWTHPATGRSTDCLAKRTSPDDLPARRVRELVPLLALQHPVALPDAVVPHRR